MFRELTEEERRELEPGPDEVLITEVGDGEYQFNTFGNAFKDLGTMLHAFDAKDWYRSISLVTATGRYNSLPFGSRVGGMPMERIFVGGYSDIRVTLLAAVRKVSTIPVHLNLGG